jgi:uncharacterized protein YunC (DUF1805 family)
MMCKRKILRKINGPRYENGYWVKVKCGYINFTRLEWLGRVVRIEGERTVKELMEIKRGGG